MRRLLIYKRFGDPRPAFGIIQQIAVESFMVSTHNRARCQFQKARESICSLERYDIIDIADTPTPFHPVIVGRTEDAL
jgi:hypothetical protein